MPITYRQHQDTRDGKIYNCVLMPDGRWWSAENLAYLGVGDDGYYSDAESETAAPPGAHIPGGPGTTSNEWNSLAIACTGDANTAAVKLKSTTGWVLNGTDDYGFNAQPSGYWRRNYTHTPWYFVPNEGDGIWGWNYTGNPSAAYQVYLPKGTQAVSTAGGFSTDRLRQRYRFIVDVFNEPIPPTKIKGAFSGSGVKAYFTNHNTATLELPISAQTTTELTIDKDFISFWGPFLGNVRILVVDGEYISEWKDWNFNA